LFHRRCSTSVTPCVFLGTSGDAKISKRDTVAGFQGWNRQVHDGKNLSLHYFHQNNIRDGKKFVTAKNYRYNIFTKRKYLDNIFTKITFETLCILVRGYRQWHMFTELSSSRAIRIYYNILDPNLNPVLLFWEMLYKICLFLVIPRGGWPRYINIMYICNLFSAIVTKNEPGIIWSMVCWNLVSGVMFGFILLPLWLAFSNSPHPYSCARSFFHSYVFRYH